MAELKKLGRYELRSILGKGAMGVVYEGYDPTLGRRVAVKTILKSVAFDDETERNYAERFVKEAKAVGRLNHPNIVQVHDFGVEDDVAYLVMEFIQGRELRSYFTAGEKFETAEVVRIMGELLDALELAHEAGVIHRDIKPANVMLDMQRRVKLADFGVARVQDSDRSAAGTMVGTPAFMSPEQISGGKIDRRSDVFSAGVVLYQLLTGEQPFKGEGAWTVAKQIMQDEPPRPSSVVQSVSPVFDGIVNKALAKKPGERFSNAREFAAALRSTQAPANAVPGTMGRAEPKASETEIEFWRAIQNSGDAAEFEFYLEQFPEGTYAALARHKIARLREAPDTQSTVRLEAEAQAKLKAAEEERARLQAEEQARRREVEEKERREAEAKAKREAEEKALREALEKTKRDAAEKAKRDYEGKIRQAQALARRRQQEEVAAVSSTPAERKTPYAIPAAIGAVVVVAGIGAFLLLGRTQAPAPVAQAPAPPKAETPAPAPPKAELSAADIEKIRKEAEDRIRREYADKSAVEQAKAAKAAADKEVQEKQLAMKAAAEKAVQEKQLAMRVAAEKAAAEKAAAEKLAADKASAEKAAAARAAEEKAATARATEEKLAAAAAKAPPVTVAATVPAAPPTEGVLPGRYAFRVAPGSGFSKDCDRIDVQEDIEIRADGRSVSGRGFSDLRFERIRDGELAATVRSIRTSWGAGDAKLTGRATAAGYAGAYQWSTGSVVCTGGWTLVRRGEAVAAIPATPAKAPPASIAAAAPASSSREGMLPGRYAFRLMSASGPFMQCDRNGFEEEIEIRAGGAQAISGQRFSNLRMRVAADGSIAATMYDGSNRFGSGDVKLTGSATATGYAGSYDWSYINFNCSGKWALVRKGESAVEKAAAAAEAPPASVAAAAPRDGLAGRYAFQITPLSGSNIVCDQNALQEDIEIRAGGSHVVSGRDFANLRLQRSPDGSVAATMQIPGRRGIGEATLAGHASANGYSGTYHVRYQTVGTCSGRWTLVRK